MAREGLGAIVDRMGDAVRVVPILVDDPGPGEVLVRVAANGICHSDHWAIHHGNWGAPFPMLLGHEAAGVIEQVGEGVEDLEPGEHVVLAWAVPCGTCALCLRGAARRCAHDWDHPPRIRDARTGAPLTGTLAIGGLATHAVVQAERAIRVPPDADLTRVCLLGCGASTGVGAAINTAGVWPGATVAVIGLGGIGLSALMGAKIAGATRLVAVDLVGWKLEAAAKLGATDTVDASQGDPVAAVREVIGGVDFAFEATGNADVVAHAVAMLGRGGTAVAIGVPRPGSSLTLLWGDGLPEAAYPNKVSLLITDGGDPLPAEDFPEWIGWYQEGRLDLDALVSREVSFTGTDVDEAFRAMLAGEALRTVVRMP